MASSVTLKAAGLNFSPNALSLPEGSLLQANNIFIRRDGVIESRRGVNEWSQNFGLLDVPVDQLLKYKGRILTHFSNSTIAFDMGLLNTAGKEIFDNFSGTYSEVQPGLRIKYIEVNGNLYFTTSGGIQKISASNASQFTTAANYIIQAGAVKSLNLDAELEIQQGQQKGFLPPDTTVNYRDVWGYRDANQILNLGAPSNLVSVFNYLSDIIPLDFNELCIVLDTIDQSPCLFNFGAYASTFQIPDGTSAIDLKQAVLDLAVQMDTDLSFASTSAPSTQIPLQIDTSGTGIAITTLGNVTITFSSGNPSLYMSIGDWINIAGLTTTTPNDITIFNNHWQLTNVTATTIEFIYVPPSGTTITPFTAAPDATMTINSYSYENITNNGDLFYQYTESLNDLIIDTPATSEEYNVIEHTILRISERLKIELPNVIPTTLQNDYVNPYNVTIAADAQLTIIIPEGVTAANGYFLQVYRSLNFTAQGGQTLGDTGGIPVIADDELRLVFEYTPTSTDFTNGFIKFLDTTPSSLVQNNTNLYTNAISGQGILQANDIPPIATDINSFKNYTFYSNTTSRNILNPFHLLGVANIANGDTITIATATSSQTYTFISGVNQVTDITFGSAATISQNNYFYIYTANNDKVYYFWFNKDNTSLTPPAAPVTGAIAIRIDILTGWTASQVAQKAIDVISDLIFDFSVVANTLPKIRVTNLNVGITTSANSGTMGAPFAISIITPGNGENAATQQVLIGTMISAAQNIDITAQSLARVINSQTSSSSQGDSPVYAYYISNSTSQPGLIDLESKTIPGSPFYVLASNSNIGTSFIPILTPDNTDITAISIANPTVITTSSPHGLRNGNQIMITHSNSTPIIDGIYTVTVLSNVTFSIPVNVTIAGTRGSWSILSDVAVSSNDVRPNRIYYSKLSQPDSVPLLNFLDVGARDKQILRIFPLRDSLFILKEDGVWRISGDSPPWNVQLFDRSCILVAPDTVDVLSNQLYCWTRKGITTITETGTSEISKPIDIQILALAASDYPNFSTITWGIGYESDSSYTVYTNSNIIDTVATLGFRYCILTNTWTNITKSENCGVILDTDDHMYLGTGNSNNIQRERKTFERTDYADNEYYVQLLNSSITNNGLTLSIPGFSNINIGDVITQDQLVTTYNFNQLLRHLDGDPTVGISTLSGSTTSVGLVVTINTTSPHNLVTDDYITLSGTDSIPSIDGTYQVTVTSATAFTINVESPLFTQASVATIKRSYLSMLEAQTGDNLRNDLVSLANKLDTDPDLTFGNYFTIIDSYSGAISSVAVGFPALVTTTATNPLIDGRVIDILGSFSPDSIPSIDGTWIISAPLTNSFTIPLDVNTDGSGGSVTYDTGPNLESFEDIQACFNGIVNALINDSGTTFKNYRTVTEVTAFEAVVLDISNTGLITMNLPLQWVVGDITVYNAINSEIIYAPVTFGDPLSLKHIYEATVMFYNRAFTQATLSFSSDLKPEFLDTPFTLQGNGIFGHYSPPGFGFGFFGGVSNAAPMRTTLPLQTQRCRFINVKFNHTVARELWNVFGITLTGNIAMSTKAYR